MTDKQEAKKKIEELIVHLRSGKFDQCIRKLHRKDTNQFCCLGVMAHAVNGASRDSIATLYGCTEKSGKDDKNMITESYELIGKQFDTVFGIGNGVYNKCISMNDGGIHSFDGIADFLEKELADVK